MSKKLKFIWIDDEKGREAAAKSLEKRIKVSIDFILVKNMVLIDALQTMLHDKREPDLLIIDHKLSHVRSSGSFNTGSTAAEYLRDSWTKCPIVSVTAVDIQNDVDSRRRNLYEQMFEDSNISDHDNTFLAIAKSFNKLNTKAPTKIEELLTLMKAPIEDHERLKTIMPHELKMDFYQSQNIISTDISRWILNVLFERPGFLYDRINAATLLGVKEESFKKIEELFKGAKYTGIFQDESKERWWKSKLLTILSKHIEGPELPWEKGRKLKGLNKKDYSECHASKKGIPETVAYVDETLNSKRYPMRLQDTIVHPGYENMLFFDEIRMMK